MPAVRSIAYVSGVARMFQWEGVGGDRHRRSGGKAPSRRRQRGLGVESPALGEFCNFSIKLTHFYAYIGQNSYFKAITQQIKTFKISLNVPNRINEVQVL